MKLYIGTYSNRHGDDSNIFTSYDDVKKDKLRIATKNWSDYDGPIPEDPDEIIDRYFYPDGDPREFYNTEHVDVPNIYPREHVEAMLCVWEEFLERKKRPEIEKYLFNYGMGQLRHDSIDIGIWVEDVYQLVMKIRPDLEGEVAYDWEFIPRLMDQLRFADTHHMYETGGRFPTPTVESGAYHYILAYGNSR